ncbi:unnamed protein product [Linum trigynum]|uniref:Uncharacterized protein n=1 Tax=Linum trigynum TaxID=586398 RepID=A0AAV2DDK2_9ROSI
MGLDSNTCTSGSRRSHQASVFCNFFPANRARAGDFPSKSDELGSQNRHISFGFCRSLFGGRSSRISVSSKVDHRGRFVKHLRRSLRHTLLRDTLFDLGSPTARRPTQLPDPLLTWVVS